jgi:hypothetical protein
VNLDIVDLGASSLNDANVPVAQCQGAPVDDGEAPDYGEVPLMCTLGLAARPAPAGGGNAQGVVLDGVPGFGAVCVGAFDPRTADTYKSLGPGETAVFSTGGGFDSRLLLKDQSASLIVGKDCVIGIDRKAQKISITGFGATVQLSAASGIVLAQGGASIVIKGGTIALLGNVVLGGRQPLAPVLSGTPVTPTPTPGVFIGG